MQLLIPDWPLPANVRAACSTREGGVSVGAFDSLNLGDHVGDEPDDVARNRALYAQALDARPVFMRQVHGWDVAGLEAHAAHGTVADAAMTRVPGVACTMMVADCLPVLFARRDGAWVAAAHAGWRGLAGQGGVGVLESVLMAFQAVSATSTSLFAIENVAIKAPDPHEITVWLGPCIGPQAFEVGPEVRAAFVASDAGSAAHFVAQPPGPSHGKYRADLAGLARRRLDRLGITAVYGNDGSASWCTVGNASRFFSHRRDQGRSGRFAASVWRV